MRPADEGQEASGASAPQSSRDSGTNEQNTTQLEIKIRERLREIEELRKLPVDDDVEMIIGMPGGYE
jgi:hypothetical protein